MRQDDGNAGGPRPLATLTIFVLFIAAWLVYGMTSHIGMAPHDDVTEAYVWGQEFQLGYNQHPPFWAWIAGLWFLVFPNREWALMLLAVVNSAIGLLGARYLIGRLVLGHAREAAWLLLLCTPFYTFNCFKYNANTIFLSIWPWTLFFFIRALQTRSVRDSVLFGAMIGVAMLSKYFAIILVLTCLLASMLHADARQYWRSASPWTSVAVAIVLFLPHAVWAMLNDAPPVHYVMSISGLSFSLRVSQGASILFAVAGLQLPIVVLIWLSRGRDSVTMAFRDRGFLAVLVVLPPILTVVLGLLFGIRLREAMLVGTFPLLPLLAMSLIPRTDPRRLAWWTSCAVVAVTVVSLISVPVTIRLLHRPTDQSWQLPIREAAEAATTLWHRTTGRPLVTVGGSKFYSNAAAFFSDDRPSGFLALDFALAPWVTPETLRKGGLLAICSRVENATEDRVCHKNAQLLSTSKTIATSVTVTHRALGAARGTATLDVYITPPES